MANASLQPIYERINGVNNYHPYTADTFADWSLEAGDIVTVSQDGKTYLSPVHKTTVRWNGHQRVELESNGEKERGPLSKMSADAYNNGNGGANGYRGGYRGSKKDNEYYTLIKNNEREIRLEAGYREAGELRLQTSITQTAESVEIAAKRYADEGDGELAAQLNVQAGLIDMVVYEDSGGKHIKGGQIALAINNGGSEAVIDATHIRMTGTTTLNDVMTVAGSYVYIKNTTIFDAGGTNMVTISGGGIGIHGQMLQVANVEKNGNDLIITYVNGTTETFSKATSLSGKWSGGKYTVTAKQSGKSVGTNVAQIKQLTPSGNVGKIGKNVGRMVSVYGTENGGSNSTYTGFQQEIWIDASDVWQDGFDAGGGGGSSHNITPGTLTVDTTAPPSSHTRVGNGAVRTSAMSSGNNYLHFTMSCGGSSKNFYIIVQK